MTALRAKALSHLRSGRVSLDLVEEDGSDDGKRIVALVASSRPDSSKVHVVDRYGTPEGGGRWECTCGDANPCAHVEAVRMVTDHGNVA